MRRCARGASLTQTAAPIAVIAAMGLAVGAWLLPLPEPQPPSPPPPPVTPPPVTQQSNGANGADDGAGNWSVLAAALQNIRKPEQVIPETPIETPTENPLEPERPAEVNLPPVNWEYIGHVREPSGELVAIMAIDGRQRFVRVGDTFPDRTHPQGEDRAPRIEITEITVELVKARRDQEIELEIERSVSDAPALMESQSGRNMFRPGRSK